ncbi:MAG: hypothetical protein C0623_05630, partial [Desulfuromonas sp.]
MTVTVASAGAHTINLWVREFPTDVGGIYLTPNGGPTAPTASTSTPTTNSPSGGGTVVDPTNCGSTTNYYGPDAASSTFDASATSMVSGQLFDLHVEAQDSCGVALTPLDCTFTWNDCPETNTVNAPTFSPSGTPITGDVTVNATGDAGAGTITVSWSEDGGSSWSPWVATGSTYTPTTCTTGNVIFRARGTSSCGGDLITVGSSVAFDTVTTGSLSITSGQTFNGNP